MVPVLYIKLVSLVKGNNHVTNAEISNISFFILQIPFFICSGWNGTWQV